MRVLATDQYDENTTKREQPITYCVSVGRETRNKVRVLVAL